MAFYGNEIGVIPLTDARGITKEFNWPSHKGLDIGWSEYKFINCPVLRWQDGIVVDRGYGNEVGNYIVVEHPYTNGKRWTGYIHLDAFPAVKKGDKVTLGKQMGNATRGNTGNSNGAHLHIYLTKIVPFNTVYTWQTMLNNCIDPKPFMYYSKKYNTDYIAPSWKKELKEMKYPTPVSRNESVHQVEIKSDTRRLRDLPNLKGKPYDLYCKRGIYNVKAWSSADGYNWALIDEIDGYKFYVAVMSGENLPITDYKALYEKEVQKNKVLSADLEKATKKLNDIKKILEV